MEINIIPKIEKKKNTRNRMKFEKHAHCFPWLSKFVTLWAHFWKANSESRIVASHFTATWRSSAKKKTARSLVVAERVSSPCWCIRVYCVVCPDVSRFKKKNLVSKPPTACTSFQEAFPVSEKVDELKMTSIWICKENTRKNIEAAEDLLQGLIWNSVKSMNVVEIVVLMQNRNTANEKFVYVFSRKCSCFIYLVRELSEQTPYRPLFLHVGKWWISLPGRFTAGEINPGYHWKGDWVGPITLTEQNITSCIILFLFYQGS